MRLCFRKIGLIVSAAALIFTSLYLPFHHHAGDVRNAKSAHCFVCHFSKEAKTEIIVSSVSGAPIAFQETEIRLGLREPGFSIFVGSISQRAPPAV